MLFPRACKTLFLCLSRCWCAEHVLKVILVCLWGCHSNEMFAAWCVCVFYSISNTLPLFFGDPVENVSVDGMCPWCLHSLPLFSPFSIFATWRGTVMELYFLASPENCELALLDNGHTHTQCNLNVWSVHSFRMWLQIGLCFVCDSWRKSDNRKVIVPQLLGESLLSHGQTDLSIWTLQLTRIQNYYKTPHILSQAFRLIYLMMGQPVKPQWSNKPTNS